MWIEFLACSLPRMPQIAPSSVRLNHAIAPTKSSPFQEHKFSGEPGGVAGRPRRGLAQLPPRLPVGLQDGRAGQQVQPLDEVHRFLRPTGMGLRPEERVAEDGREEGEEVRRRQPRLGLRRSGSGEGWSGGAREDEGGGENAVIVVGGALDGILSRK